MDDQEKTEQYLMRSEIGRKRICRHKSGDPDCDCFPDDESDEEETEEN